MPLELHYHPLSSYSMKVLIALYEGDVPFERRVLDPAKPETHAAYAALWPLGKFPALRDATTGRFVVESSIVIEHLAQRFPGAAHLLPRDPEVALEIRFRDRFFDLYVMTPMQKIVGDRLRPADARDPYGVDEAKRTLATAYAMIEDHMATRTWAAGDGFTMADCAAAPSLFYASKVVPFGDAHRHVAAYLARLTERPSFARALREAEPYFALFPKG